MESAKFGAGASTIPPFKNKNDLTEISIIGIIKPYI